MGGLDLECVRGGRQPEIDSEYVVRMWGRKGEVGTLSIKNGMLDSIATIHYGRPLS
jgi:hypothetical protein